MSDDAMGDEVYQPPASDPQDIPNDLDMEDALDEPGLDEFLDTGYSPPERPFVVNHEGTTAREQHERESLAHRLSVELPDIRTPDGDGIGDLPDGAGEPYDDQVGEERAGRLVGSDEGFWRGGGSNDIVGRDVGIDGGAASAEEAAVHIAHDVGGTVEGEV
ncbi:hypothetical protein ADL22_00475 [Streptomyces sp. NRRL F-4489]|uniref:DUF5709 domain-containing protein n=1 Tax=Streptomyces sp. NRRL F-4489 TaxID=1609095 RepID=UPI000748B393|nr:DUF5709 domain-containing protein [Streptomyces sp. NRRL F-4489]KUL55404.1 hypothetical protein ADL22_00475 [Streptomyces sp. NRRL F-4489]